MTKDENGKLDTADMVRLFSNHVSTQQELTTVNSESNTTIEQLRQENQQLKQHLAINEMLVNQLQQQIQDLKQDKQRLFDQLEQKLIESKTQEKRGLLGRIFG